MPVCPKCGATVPEGASFCPNCGRALKIEGPSVEATRPTQPPAYERYEKHEKREKGEKTEKTEKREKSEYSYAGPIIAGVVLIILGLLFYVNLIIRIDPRIIGTLFLVAIGVIIIVVAVYTATMAARRHPST
jgi:uncharacterized membrane protein YvbJ